MRAVLLGLLVVVWCADAMAQQDSVALVRLAPSIKSKFSFVSGSKSSSIIAPPATQSLLWLSCGPYTFQQGKLPLFCALEDRLWRSTGLGIRFRITDAPIGSNP